ncbi:restriction endonuclease [Streptomyces specialis]|uniref:restriction endonuclease n=1 Tax=Streptomyces specialis TaxID=498367 RepID=UPI00073EF10A|nr:restriction endonuclease [Streptomyces specialis]
MIIDRTARVVPTKFRDKMLREWMGDWIGKAGPDELLASFLWCLEGYAARSICQDAARLEKKASLMREKGSGRLASIREGHPLPYAAAECLAAGEKAVARTGAAAEKIRSLCKDLDVLFRSLQDEFGSDLVETRHGEAGGYISPLDEMMQKWDQVIDLDLEIEEAWEQFARDFDEAGSLHGRREEYIKNEHSFPLEKIDSFDAGNFEILISWLAFRDGLKVIREKGGAGDLGADVIAKVPDGRTVVFQCKHTRGGRAVGSGALQKLNGTARQVHGADIVVMVASGGYSDPAVEFAHSQEIHLVDRQALQRWAEYGDPVYSVLGVPPPAAGTL